MKRFMLFLAFGLAATEKLDRTYLPPPGSKYAGGESGDLQVPLEFPKQAYTTTAPQLPGQKINEPPSFGDTRLVPGSFRGPGQDFSGTTPVTPSSKLPFNYYQNKVPTTTTSYAFTQTTTFPPSEGFETTLSPILPVEGPLGEQPGFINPPFIQGQTFDQKSGQNRPNFVQPINQIPQRPGFFPNLNGSGGQTSFPGSQTVTDRPVYTQGQNINQNQQNVPSSTASPIGSRLQPGLVTSPPQGYTQHLGVQPPRQFNQQGYFPSSTSAPVYQTGIPSQYDGDVSNIQTKVNGLPPSGYPSNSPSGYSPSTTAAPGYQTGIPSQNNGDISNIQTTRVNGQQPSGYPSGGPQGYFPSSTAAPGYQTGFPPQNNGDISNIQTTRVNGQQPLGYPSGGSQGYSLSSTAAAAAPGYQTGFPSQYGSDISNIQTTKGNGQQPSRYPTNSPQQSTTQFIDKYGNIQNNDVPGFSVPQKNQQGQNPSPRPGQTQFGPQGSSDTGLTHVQQEAVSRPQYIDQNGSFLTSAPSQGTSIPGTSGAQQQGDQQFVSQQGPYLPTTSSGGISNNQGYQRPQFVNQQGNFPSTEISQSTPIPGTSLNQPQRTQRPEFGTQQNIYPPPGTSQRVYPQIISQGGQQPQQQLGSGQRGLYPSNLTPGQVGINQQGGQPQFIEQQGAIVPGQFNYQRPANQNPQTIDQQNSRPINGYSQGSSIPGQINIQQTQLSPQSFQAPGIVNALPSKQDGNNVLNKIPLGSNALGQNQFNENFPTTGPVPFGQSQEIGSRIPSQYPKPGDQRIITDGSLNNQRPGAAVLPSDYQQPFITSTTPSSIPSYGSTPGTLYPSTASPILENDFGGKRPGIITSRPERPQAESDRNAVILNYDNVLTPEGFAYSFDTSNGIHADENGTAIDGVKANGSYSYIGDDGKLYSVVYTADENGFRPHGDHLPTPPPVPKAIQQVIEQATKDKEAGISHDGFYDDEKYGHKKYQVPKHRRPETQDKLIDGADESESNYKDRDNKKKIKPNDDRKSVSTYGKNPSEVVYDNNKYDIDDDMTEIGMDGKIQKHFNKNNLSRRPVNKIPGKNDFEVKQERNGELPQLTGQDSARRRPFGQEKESPRRRPGTSSHKGKPVFTKDQYDIRQKNNENKFTEQEEDLSYGNEDDERRIPPKTTGTKYSGSEGDYQQTNDDELQYPKRFETKESDAGGIKGVKRPISHGTQSVKTSNGLKQTSIKGTRPQKPFKDTSKTFGTRYQVSDDDSSDQKIYEEPKLYDQEDQDISDLQTMGPTYTKNEFTYKQKPGVDYKENTFDKIKYPTDIRSKQKGHTYDQQSNENGNRDIPEQSDNEETGYQYNPPQNKFNQGEKDRFPTRFSDKAVTKTSVNTYKMSDKKTTVQPFITPNVHRDDDGSYEDVSEENSRLKESEKMTSRIPEYTTTEDSSEYFDEQSETEQQFDGEDESSDKIRPVKPGKTTLVYRPGYQSQETTEKPEYYYDENTTEKKRKMPVSGSKRPENDRYPSDFGKQTTQGGPEQDYSEETIESKKPIYTYTSSTTPKPFRKPLRPVYKQTSTQGQPQYSTTYEPSDTSSTEETYNEGVTRPGYTSTKSTSRRPGTSGSVSNTTPSTRKDLPGASRTKIVSSRPTNDYSSDRTMIPESPTIRPGISESAFGKPSDRPGGSRKPSYSANTQQSTRPNYNEDYDRKNPEGESVYSVQDGTNYPEKTINESATPETNFSQNFGQSGRKDVPSTTYRPNYLITSISQPGSVSVDMIGRPLRPVPGSGTTQPGVPVSSSQGTPSNVYQDTRVIRPEQVTFKPSEARFGGAVQRIPGQKPAEFGPSAFTTPGYLEPYGPSTGKIIGEDFSGPKQQQKYDPETGYYY